MASQTISFFSEGVRLAGDLYLPGGLRPASGAPGSSCVTAIPASNLYLPDNARVLTGAGYAVLTFDYKGWGDSEGPRSRLSPYGRVIDSQAALTWLGGAADGGCGAAGHLWHQLRRCHGGLGRRGRSAREMRRLGCRHRQRRRWMRSVRRPDEFHDLLDRSAADR